MNEDFKYIAAIAEHGSISKAARAVHITQPGLSQRLKRLEAQMGTELFHRGSLPLKPTPAGEVFLKYAQRAIAAENNMRREVYGVASSRRQSIRVGVSMSRANALMAGPIVEFYETHRGCTVELEEMGTLEQMHRLFLGGRIDFAVLTPLSPDPSLYSMEVLCRERLLVVASSKLEAPQLHRSHAGKLSIHQLEGIPFVLPDCGGYFGPLLDEVISSSHAQLDIVVRNCSAELALSLVHDGLGVSIVPSTWIMGREGFQLLGLGDVEAGNVLRYIRRSDRVVSKEEELFMDLLRSWLRDQIEPTGMTQCKPLASMR